MPNNFISSGIIPNNLVYGEYDIYYTLTKQNEDKNHIYYECIMQEYRQRRFEFIFNKQTNIIEIINQVSEKYPIFRRMAVEYTDEMYDMISNMYIIDEDYKTKVYTPDFFGDPYFRFSQTKNGISVGIALDYMFRVKNGINVKVKMPKDYNDL